MSNVVYILEDEYSLRSTMQDFLKQNKYQVHSFSDPTFCPLSEKPSCTCQEQYPCADYIITDINMPGMTGLKFIEQQRNKNCKAPHIAIMSATWSEREYQKARELACKVFEKPFNLSDLLDWMQECEENPYMNIVPNNQTREKKMQTNK